MTRARERILKLKQHSYYAGIKFKRLAFLYVLAFSNIFDKLINN
jgi:hypothetical protein